MLREVAELTGLADGVTTALLDTYRGLPVHAPGRVFADLACAVADGADAISGIAVLGDRKDLFGPVASMPTTWRLLYRIDAAHLQRVRQARAAATGCPNCCCVMAWSMATVTRGRGSTISGCVGRR